MKLDINNKQTITDPDDQAIADSLASLTGVGDSFAILGTTDATYIQTAGSSQDGFSFEFQRGTMEKHYRSERLLSLDEVTQVFQEYSRRSDAWKHRFMWVKVDLSSPATHVIMHSVESKLEVRTTTSTGCLVAFLLATTCLYVLKQVI